MINHWRNTLSSIVCVILFLICIETSEATLGTNQPAITLSSAVRGAGGVIMIVSLTPTTLIPPTGRIVITLSGSGLSVFTPNTLTFIAGGAGGAGTAAIAGSPPVLTVTMTAGTFTGGSPLTFTIAGITNPTLTQAASTTTAAATTNNAGAIIGTSNTGSFVAIVTDTLGTNNPAVTLSSAVRGAGGVTMTVTLTPAVTIPSDGRIVITLSGAGLAVASPGTLTFTVGGAGGAGTATISATGVLTVTMTAGTFIGGAALVFSIPGITNPTLTQDAQTIIAAATIASIGVNADFIIGASNTGSFVAIVASGPLGRIGGVTFVMTSAQRTPNAAASAAAVVTVGFKLATAYAAAGADQITINFPSNFFLTSTPTVSCTGGTGLTATVAYAANSQFVLTTTTTAWDTTAKVCTFSQVATGAATLGSAAVTVQSTQDQASSPAVASGALGGQVTGVTFAMTSAQRVPNAAAVAFTAVVTVGFQLGTAFAAVGANQITITFPTSFFLTSVPTVACTGGTGLTATVA
jgi:hypothetical protein